MAPALERSPNGYWMFGDIYPASQTEDYKMTFARFTEELGELGEALRVSPVAPGYFLSEASDVFAWLMHLQAHRAEVQGPRWTRRARGEVHARTQMVQVLQLRGLHLPHRSFPERWVESRTRFRLSARRSRMAVHLSPSIKPWSSLTRPPADPPRREGGPVDAAVLKDIHHLVRHLVDFAVSTDSLAKTNAVQLTDIAFQLERMASAQALSDESIARLEEWWPRLALKNARRSRTT